MSAFRFSKKNKFGAKRTNGFPSRLESAVFDHLKIREGAGEIADIKRYPSVELQGGIRWKVDFSFVEIASSKLVYAEAKGVATADYRIKLRLWKSDPPARLEIWKGKYYRDEIRLFLSEVIE